jgi:hypothetical protein
LAIHAQLEVQILREDLDKAAVERDHYKRCYTDLLAERAPVQLSLLTKLKPPSSVVEAVQRAEKEYADSLVFHGKAFESAEDSPYRHPPRVYAALGMLGECARLRRRAASARKPVPGIREWFRDRAAEVPGVEYAAHESATTLGKWGDERTVEHHGKRFTMEQHLCLGDGHDPAGCLRIYFLPDPETRQFVVGYVGRHLTNTRT